MPVDLDDFPDLWQRWTVTKDERRRRTETTRHELVVRWRANLADLDQAQADMIADGRWASGRSSLMSILGIRLREVYHCRVLRWLLSPTGKHGFCEAILLGVWQRCFPDDVPSIRDLRLAKVTVEDYRDHLRTDIVVRTPTQTLIIEAKTTSPESDRQCDATYERFSTTEKVPHFIFLTPKGIDPETASGEAKRAFRTLSWETIASLVDETLSAPREGQMDRIAVGAAQNYLHTLKSEFV